MSLFAEKIGKDEVYQALLKKLQSSLNYYKNYDKFEEKWKKILRRYKMSVLKRTDKSIIIEDDYEKRERIS